MMALTNTHTKPSRSIHVDWRKCEGQQWCSLDRVNLDKIHEEGVYIIWSGKQVVYVGQGIVRDRLASHRSDPRLTRFRDKRVTWASVTKRDRDGVERFLADRLSPVVGEAHPDAPQIGVNLPW
jgi:hypothetical protein